MEIPDLTQWKFVRKDVMRSKTVGDWDTANKEIQVWSGVDEVTALEVFAHELVEMITCSLLGVTDEMMLKYDRSHDFAMDVSERIIKAAGENSVEHEKKIVEYEDKVKVEEKNE